MRKISTLSLLLKGSKVLLALKKYGFSEGKWGAFEGQVREEEDIEAAAKRSLKEEAGLEVFSLEKIGILEFEFHGDPDINEVHIFKADAYEGEIIETDQVRPEWFCVKHIPYETMWQDNEYWLPFLLEDKKFVGKFFFDKDQNIINHSLLEVDEF